MSDTSISDIVGIGQSGTNTPSVSDIRKLKRSERRSLPHDEQKHHSQMLCENVTGQQIYKSSKRIACYIANDGEIDPWLIVEHARFARKKVYLPVLSPMKNSLYFAPYEADSGLILNRFSIPEPVCHPSKWLSAWQLDLLLLPLVAFDERGNRLGMGGGFYDRTLAYMKCRQHWKKPVLAGLAHEIQKTENLSSQSWDVPLDFIMTEQQIYTT